MNDKKTKTCCFTGHRSSSLPFGFDESREECRKLIALLEENIQQLYEKRGVRIFISGMALGVDQIAAEAVIRFRETHKDVVFVAAVPCTDQPKKWKSHEQDRYYDILAKADHIYTLVPSYTPECMMERNRFMVDNSQYVIAVWNGKRFGGTLATLNYAKSQSKIITIINPKTFNVKTYVPKISE